MKGYGVIALGSSGFNMQQHFSDSLLYCGIDYICPCGDMRCEPSDVFCDVDWGCGCSGENDMLCACGRSRPV